MVSTSFTCQLTAIAWPTAAVDGIFTLVTARSAPAAAVSRSSAVAVWVAVIPEGRPVTVAKLPVALANAMHRIILAERRAEAVHKVDIQVPAQRGRAGDGDLPVLAA